VGLSVGGWDGRFALRWSGGGYEVKDHQGYHSNVQKKSELLKILYVRFNYTSVRCNLSNNSRYNYRLC
jgi:hypothetical protein